MNKNLYILAPLLFVSSCGGERKSSTFKKQRGESVLKIETLDLDAGKIKTIFEYRSYQQKKLERLDCDFSFGKHEPFNIKLLTNITLGAFAKEALNFEVQGQPQIENLKSQGKINYNVKCEISYDEGKEIISYESSLFQLPNKPNQYR